MDTWELIGFIGNERMKGSEAALLHCADFRVGLSLYPMNSKLRLLKIGTGLR